VARQFILALLTTLSLKWVNIFFFFNNFLFSHQLNIYSKINENENNIPNNLHDHGLPIFGNNLCVK